MKNNRFLPLLLLFSLLLPSLFIPAAALEEPDLQCANAVLLDANHGEILLDKRAHETAYPASLTKVMTALLALEAIESGQFSADSPITAGENIYDGLSIYGSTANIKAGETLPLEELLYCLMLPSANEAANIIAEAVSGTKENFVALMNRRAGELGCEGTHFANPHGLHDEEHYTTAYDIALMMVEALNYDLFRTIISSSSHTVPATNLSEERFFYNTNGLISNLYYAGYVYDKCIGGKTGTTDEAGRCLVSAAEEDETLLISVILGSGPIEVEGYANLRQGQFTESTKLLKWGFSNFERVTITRSSEPVDKVAVTLSRQSDEVMVKPQGSIVRTLPKDLDPEDIETEITLFSPTVEAPVEEGQVLGTMKLSYEGTVYGTLDLVAVNAVERSDLLYKKAQFLTFFEESGIKVILAVVLLIAAVLVLKFVVFSKRRRYRSSSVRSRGRGNYRGTRR